MRFILRPGILEQSCVVSLGKLGNHYGTPLIRKTLHIYAELSPELAQTSSIICPLLSYMMFNFFFHSHRSIYDMYIIIIIIIKIIPELPLVPKTVLDVHSQVSRIV